MFNKYNLIYNKFCCVCIRVFPFPFFIPFFLLYILNVFWCACVFNMLYFKWKTLFLQKKCSFFLVFFHLEIGCCFVDFIFSILKGRMVGWKDIQTDGWKPESVCGFMPSLVTAGFVTRLRQSFFFFPFFVFVSCLILYKSFLCLRSEMKFLPTTTTTTATNNQQPKKTSKSRRRKEKLFILKLFFPSQFLTSLFVSRVIFNFLLRLFIFLFNATHTLLWVVCICLYVCK